MELDQDPCLMYGAEVKVERTIVKALFTGDHSNPDLRSTQKLTHIPLFLLTIFGPYCIVPEGNSPLGYW